MRLVRLRLQVVLFQLRRLFEAVHHLLFDPLRSPLVVGDVLAAGVESILLPGFVDRVRAAITEVLYQLEGFDDQFRQILEEVQLRSENNPSAQLKQLEAEVAQVAREKENLLAAIKTWLIR